MGRADRSLHVRTTLRLVSTAGLHSHLFDHIHQLDQLLFGPVMFYSSSLGSKETRLAEDSRVKRAAARYRVYYVTITK